MILSKKKHKQTKIILFVIKISNTFDFFDKKCPPKITVFSAFSHEINLMQKFTVWVAITMCVVMCELVVGFTN